MRILWISDSPTTPSGFGGVTAAICRRLAARGHHVEILGWQSRGATSWWEGMPVHPVRNDQFGADVLTGYLLRIRPQFVVTLGDVWWMAFLTDAAVQQYLDQSGARWALYYPIDGATPDGRLPAGWRRVLQASDVPIAMSRFGQAVSSACGVEAAYIPHGTDLDLFAPPADKEGAKARLGYAGRFVVLSDARNQPRKLLPRTLDIAALFAEGRDDVVVHLHTDPDDDASRSDLYRYNLRADIEALGLRDRIQFTHGFRMRASAGLTVAELAALYQAADVHLLSSWGEGFGLPTLQAAAAGTVPMAVAYSASRELVEGHGIGVPVESAVVDEFGLVRCLLSREAAVNGLADLYDDRELLRRRSAESRQFALAYGWDAIAAEWERVLLEAPPRRKPERSSVLAWVAGSRVRPVEPLPAPVLDVAAEVFDPLPEGTTVSVRFTERTVGEISGEIRRQAFVDGDELSIPVRLGAFFDDAPRPRVGALLVSPPDLPTAALAGRIFPGLRISVPRPDGNPESDRLLPLEEIAPALLDIAMVIDHSGSGAANLDLACAALGVPYLGPSALWPATGDILPPARDAVVARVREVRLLLTDQGLSEWRRQRAYEAALATYGEEVVAAIRATALAGHREAEARALARAAEAKAAQPPPAAGQDGASQPQMFLVRRRDGVSQDANLEIARHAAAHGGLLLMATRTGSLIVAMPEGGKEILSRHPQVGFVGPVSIDPDGRGARALRSHFARNAAAQLAAAGLAGSALGSGR